MAVSAHLIGAGRRLERKDVTDVDVLGIKFCENLQPQIVVAECKTGRHYEALDRTLWLAGLMHLLKADRGYLIVDSPKNLARRIAPDLDIAVIDGARLAAWEDSALVQKEWRCSFDPEMDVILDAQFDEMKSKAYNEYYYVKYRFWQEGPADQLKHLLSVTRALSTNKKLQYSEIRWFMSAIIPSFAVSILGFASRVFAFNPGDTQQLVQAVVTEWHGGEMTEKRHRDLAEAFQELLRQELKAHGIAKQQSRIQDYMPEPGYVSSSLADLIARFLVNPQLAAEIPRFLDTMVFDSVLRKKKLEITALQNDFGSEQRVHSIAK
ncbi:MAG: hypothetical protein MUO81_08235, partial [Thermoplasmata archaeon]|nr:hypothetical protein [Thermoplasmata archaeon]